MTIQDIARLAGVSSATVSGVLNNSPLVSAKTTKRVLAIIEEHNYQPNHLARALALRQTGIVGLLIKDISNPLYSRIALGVEQACEQKQYTVIIGNTHKQWQREVRYVSLLKQRRLDGLILLPLQKGVDLGHIHELKQAHFPFILLGEVPGIDADVVRADDEQGARTATEHLIHLGRKNIAYLNGPDTALAGDRRCRGYQTALAAHDLVAKPELVWPGGWRLQDGYRAGQQFGVSSAARADAVLCYNDSLAIGFMRALTEQGIRVPDDVAVVGFDDAGLGGYLQTALTTVAQPALEIGRCSADLLLQRIAAKENGGTTQKMYLATRLVVRESCGALSRGSFHSSPVDPSPIKQTEGNHQWQEVAT